MPNAEMKTLTIGDTTYEIVDEEAREREGDLSDLNTQVQTDLVAAINEVADNSGVVSVNGKTGTVVLAAADVGAATTGALTDETTARTAADAQLQSQITALGNGAPIPVSTIAAMTDQTKVYLYTGTETDESTGYWYTYDSAQAKFVPRGEYGAGVIIDATFTIPNAAAASTAVGGINDRVTTIEYITTSPTFEQGTISSSYKPADNANRIRTIDVFEVGDFASAECDSGHSIWWVEYKADMTGNALHMKGTLKSVTPADFTDGTAYVRFVLVNSASATPITPSDGFTFNVKTSRITKIDAVIEEMDIGFADINLIDDSDWEIGGFDDKGFQQVIYRMRTVSLYHVKAGDKIIFAVPSDITGSVKYEIGFYENDVLTSLSGKLSTNYTFDNDYDIRIDIGLAGSYDPVNPELKRCVSLYAATYSDSIVSRSADPLLTAGRVIQRRQNMGLPFAYHNHYIFGDSIACDFFFMGNDLWTFSAAADDNSTFVSYTVRTYDPDTDSFTYKKGGQHNLGHVNSMSYSAGNDCLLCGNGSGDYTLQNKFFICPNLSELTGNIDINTNCIVYDCSALDIGSKLNVIWGDANKGAYDIAYGITDDNAHIYKILLGRGTNALTYGTLISGKTDAEFNGTFAIVETYSQDVCGYETCVQGSTFYKGSIYAGIGHNVTGIRVWKMTPQRDGTIHTEEYTEPMWGQDMAATGNVGGISTWHDRFFISMGAGNVYAYDATVQSDDLSNDVDALETRVTAVESDVAEINNALFTVEDIWPQAEISEGNSGQGYYYTDGVFHDNSAYSYIAYQAPETIEVYATSAYTTAFLNIYNSNTFDNTTLVTSISKQVAGLPTEADPLTVDAGNWIVLSHKSANLNQAIYYAETQKTVKKPYMGKTWAAVGDSWTAVNSYATVRYHDFIAEDLGFTVGNYGVSGTGYFVNGGVTNKEFYNRVTDLGTPDVVTIFGSGNDCTENMVIGEITDTTPTTICGAINYTISQYLTAYPNTPLGIIAPAPWRHDGFYPANPNSRMTTYVDAMEAICKRRGVPFLDLYRCSSLFPEIEADRTTDQKVYYNTNHINDRGQKLIYPKIRAFLETLI